MNNYITRFLIPMDTGSWRRECLRNLSQPLFPHLLIYDVAYLCHIILAEDPSLFLKLVVLPGSQVLY